MVTVYKLESNMEGDAYVRVAVAGLEAARRICAGLRNKGSLAFTSDDLGAVYVPDADTARRLRERAGELQLS